MGEAPEHRWQGLRGKLQQAQVDALVFMISLYKRMISPLLPPSCRFYPTCSGYAQEALRRHGVWRGTRLAAGRLLKCHPLHAGGVDPVP